MVIARMPFEWAGPPSDRMSPRGDGLRQEHLVSIGVVLQQMGNVPARPARTAPPLRCDKANPSGPGSRGVRERIRPTPAFTDRIEPAHRCRPSPESRPMLGAQATERTADKNSGGIP